MGDVVITFLLLASTPLPLTSPHGGEGGVPPVDGTGLGGGDGGAMAALVPDENYTRVEQPPWVTQFADSMSCVGDVDADGTEDLMVGANLTYAPGDDSYRPNGNYMLMGRPDGNFTTSQLWRVQNTSHYWMTEDQRRAGDVNGDGYADVVSLPYGTFGFNGVFWDAPFLQVRYGGPGGIPNESSPDTVDVRPSNMTGVRPPSMLYGGVGDVNGDGYDDVCVLLAPCVDSQGAMQPGQLELFYGSPAGIIHAPNWTRSIPASEMDRWRSVLAIHHADIDGDGYSDVVLWERWSAGHDEELAVFRGSADGIPSEPSMTVDLRTPDYHHVVSVFSPVDVNGDSCEDIVVDTREPMAHIPEVVPPVRSTMYLVLGAPNGSDPTVRRSCTFTVDTRLAVAVADIDGDGLDDIVRCSPKYESGVFYAPEVGIELGVYFNAMGRFGNETSWDGRIDYVNYTGLVWNIARGDLDGDGFDDLAMGLRGTATCNGSIVIVSGESIIQRSDPVETPRGSVFYAMHGYYDVAIRANLTTSLFPPESVTVVLDPGGAAVGMSCALRGEAGTFSALGDLGGYATLSTELSRVSRNESTMVLTVHFMVRFDWTWPTESNCSVLTKAIVGDASKSFLTMDVFRVEKDLALRGPLSASGGWQGPLAEGAWVRAGENVTVSGAVVVYEGTTDVYPPEGCCSIVMANDAGDSTSVMSNGGSGLASLSLVADRSTDLVEELAITLGDLPPTSRCIFNLSFRLRVDGDLPVFKRAVPEASDWHSSSRVLVSITADDRGMSGVDSSSLEYSFSTTGRAGFGDWSRAGLAVTSDGPEVDGLVALTLPDGAENYVRWRVMDLVGNGLALSDDLNIKVDTQHVTYSDPTPPDGEWQTSLALRAGVVIHDEAGSGIDLATVQYRLSPRNLSQYGEWLPWNASAVGTAPTLEASVQVMVVEAPYNFIQWRAFDIAGNGFTTSPHYRIPADVTPISFRGLLPAGGAIQTINPVWCWATADDGPMGSGVDLSRMEFRCRNGTLGFTDWTPVGMVGSATNATFSVRADFEDGLSNAVQFRGYDVAGNGPSVSEENVIAIDTRPPDLVVREPAASKRYVDAMVDVEVAATDATSGVDGRSLWYRVGSTGAGGYGNWSPLEVTSEGAGFKGTARIGLSPGPVNLVQVCASDMVGNGVVLDPVKVWVNRPPAAKISSPLNGSVLAEGEAVRLVGNSSSDPDGDELTYEWTFDVPSVAPRSNATCELDLPPGPCNITLTVKDPFGGTSSAAITVNVTAQERPAPPGGRASLWPWLILVLIAVACAILIGWRAYRDRRQRDGTGPDGR